MLGLMQSCRLTVDHFLVHAARWHGQREVVTRSEEGPIVRETYADLHRRARQCSNALRRLGIVPGDRVATLAWNGARHMETWYGVMGIGAVCHTLNPRLFDETLVYIINHAADRIVFADASFAPLLGRVLVHCPCVERVVWLTDAAHAPAIGRPSTDYESLIAGESADCAWGDFDENTAAALCYTSGTTANPKGVLYSHRSNYLHTMLSMQTDVIGLSASDVVLPIVPMFHANAWGLTFAAPASGTKLVLPGHRLDGASVFELLETEGVTCSAGVPTVWQGLLHYLQETGRRPTTLRRIIIGGAACPEALMRAYGDELGIEVRHAWGMTEMSPIGTVGAMVPEIDALPPQDQLAYRIKQGRVPCGVDMEIMDDEGRALPHDGRTFGHLKVKGPAVAAAYFREDGSILDAGGWFDTGDIATLDGYGFMRITDRAKDVIKSGGEWISSIELENLAVAHPKTALAAVVGVPDATWGERPLLIVKLKPGVQATREEYLAFLAGHVAKWWLPDEVRFVPDIPLGATGKIDKKRIRAELTP